MADNLKIFGTPYYDVQGQKFTDLDGNEKTYIRPVGTKQIAQNGTADVKKFEFAEVAVPASAVDEGTKQITQNGDGQDVVGYAAVDVNVPGIVPAGTKQINQNGTHDVAQYASAEVNVPNTYAASDEGKVVSSGTLVAQTSQTIDENGTYDTTLKNEVVVDVQGGGGITKAEGDFTIVSESDGNFPVLTHNLHTRKIAVIVYPTGKITGNGGYRNFYAFWIASNELLNGKTWTFDWTSYNSHFSGDETVTLPSNVLREGAAHVSPWATQGSWNAGGNPATIDGGEYVQNRVVLTDDTVKINGAGSNRTWCIGTYHWIVWALE